MKQVRTLLCLGLAATVVAGQAHDIWIEAGAQIVRSGEWTTLNLMLGNHGNNHRDFKLASKVAAGDQSLVIYGPNNLKLDLTSTLVDNGYTAQEGFWSARFQAPSPGLYLAASTFDKVMSYAPVRDIKSAKAFFVASPTLDSVKESNPGFDKVLGHALEIVPVINPVTPMGPGTTLKVKVLFKGKPLAGAKVSFIPKGIELSGEMDARFEKKTDASGMAQLDLKESTRYLIATHYRDNEANGEGYQGINYSATITVLVPTRCPCCG